MFSHFFLKKKKSTAISRFVREASSAERKKVFMEVLRKATGDQQKIIREGMKIS